MTGRDRSMRSIVAVLIAALVAITLSGCGGGGNQTAEQPPATEAPAPAAAPVAGQASAGVQTPTDASKTETLSYSPLVSKGVTAPAAVADRIKAKQPFILVFYDAPQPVTDDQKAIISGVLKKYRGLVGLVTYNVGKHVSQDESSTITVKDSLLKDKSARQAVEFARGLRVNFTPYVIVVDKYGYTTYRGRGLVDGKTLEREVLRVGE